MITMSDISAELRAAVDRADQAIDGNRNMSVTLGYLMNSIDRLAAEIEAHYIASPATAGQLGLLLDDELVESDRPVSLHHCMAAIDPANLQKAMSLAPMTPKQLADATGMSLTYVCDITAGRRTLKRNPDLRKRIAKALNVPQHWIEHAEAAA